jgi:ABC-type taurine transport system ATPase subunit
MHVHCGIPDQEVHDGVALTRPPRDVGIAFQEAVLLEWRTVVDNVLLPAEILGIDKTKARVRAMYLLDRVGLPGSSGVSHVNCRAACDSGSRSAERSFTTRRSC